MIETFRKSVIAVLSAFVMVACVDNDPFNSYGDDSVNVTFTAALDNGNHGSRAGESQSDLGVTHVRYQVFTSTMQSGTINETFTPTAVSDEITINGSQVNINVDFVKNQQYRIVFLAYNKQKSESDDYPYTISNDLTSLSIDYSKYTAGHDLFYAVTGTLQVDASGNLSEAARTVTLKRPYATISLGTEDETEEYVSETVKVTFAKDLYTHLDLTTGYPAAAGSVKEFFAAVDMETTSSMTVNNKPVYKFASFNVLTHPTDTENTMSFSLDADGVTKTDIPVTLTSNYLVKVAGDIVEVRAWDGVTFTAPKTVPDKCSVTGYALHVETPDQLAYLLTNGTTQTLIHICNDMDMGGHALSTVANLPEGTTISGLNADGERKHVIFNLQLNNVSGLFGGVANNLKINNLEIGGVTLNSNSVNNTGILLGKATGTLEMTNVTVDGCTVNGSRNVGGMVGYIDGNAVFAGCVSRNVTTTASGDPATVSAYTDYKTTGAIVGVFKGNTAEETLTFDADCSVEGYTTGAGAYVAENQSCWVADGEETWSGTPEVKYDNALGNEEFCRGTVNYGAVRIVPHWDGIRRVAPLLDTDNKTKLIYSPFDLASLQGVTTTHSAVTFKSDVDMSSMVFEPIDKIQTLDGENHTLYNLKVDYMYDGEGAAFIQTTSGTTTHKNLNFYGADIHTVHNPNYKTPDYGVTNDGGAGNAYAGTLVATCRGDIYSVENVHASKGKIYAVCKMGGLIGAGWAETLTVTDCSVDSYTLENYNPQVPNYYTLQPEEYKDIHLQPLQDNDITNGVLALAGIHKIPEFGRVHLLQWWYTCGEVGGLIGFVKCETKADITRCSVTNTAFNCVGQPNKYAVANVWDKKDFSTENPFQSGKKIFAKGSTDIAGRHVNQFIGDVVSARKESATIGYDVTITDYTVNGNSYNGTAASATNSYSHNYASGKYCEVVGCAYYVGVDVKVIVQLSHVNDRASVLTINNGGVITTIEEEVGNGSGIAWVGGDFKDLEYNQKKVHDGWDYSGWFPKEIYHYEYNVDSYYPTFP